MRVLGQSELPTSCEHHGQRRRRGRDQEAIAELEQKAAEEEHEWDEGQTGAILEDHAAEAERFALEKEQRAEALEHSASPLQEEAVASSWFRLTTCS
eukprot:2427349-Pyramimonas_sp.AAC.1